MASGRPLAEVADLSVDDFQALHEATAMRWTHTDELLALVLEQLGILHQTLCAVNGAKKHELPKPVRYPRPHDPDRRPAAASRAEIAARIPLRR